MAYIDNYRLHKCLVNLKFASTSTNFGKTTGDCPVTFNFRVLINILSATAISISAVSAFAQDGYPNKPIKIIVGVAPGGLIDGSARLMATQLAQRLGQPVLVDNRPGASTTIAANAVSKGVPDGYTFFYGGALSASPILTKNSAVDFTKQMQPVSMVLSAPLYVLVSNKVPAKTMSELISYSKQNPGKLNFADIAPASTLTMHAVSEKTGFNFTPISYKGSAPALMALVSGEVDLTLDTVANYLPHIKAGTVRAIMNTGQARMKVLPDVPTGHEEKLIDFNSSSVFGLWAPLGTPEPIVQRLSKEIAAISKVPEFIEKFRIATFVDPQGTTPAELLKATELDYALFSGVAKRIGHVAQ